MQSKTSWTIAGLAAALAVGIVAFVVLRKDDQTPPITTDALPALDRPPLSSSTPVVDLDHGISLPKVANPLSPERETELDGIPATPAIDARIADLKKQADAGDLDAACKMLMELRRCGTSERFDSFRYNMAIDYVANGKLEGEELKAATKRLASIRDAQQALMAGCSRVPPSTTFGRLPYLLKLAEAGSTQAMARFASGNASELVASPESYALYRQHGFDMLRRAIEAGEPEAVQAWQAALQFDFSPLNALLPEDWRQLELANALFQRIDPKYGRGAAMYGDLSDNRSDAAADDLYQRYFANSPEMARWASDKEKRVAHYTDMSDDPITTLERLSTARSEPVDECDLSAAM